MSVLRWILAAVLLLGALPAGAADKTVGVIMSGNMGYYQEVHKAFSASLGKEGFDFRTVDTLLQMPSPDSLSWANAARKLVVADVNVLVSYGAPAALAMIRETKSIPLVYAGVYSPEAAGVTARNMTGISAKVPLTSLLKYLKKMTPFTRVAAVYNEFEPDSVKQVEELVALESQYGFKTIKMAIKRPDEARKLVFTGKADAVLISVSAAANEAIGVIVQQAREAKIPVISQIGGTAEHGITLSLSPSPSEQGAAAGRMVARLLKGEKPASIPVEVPRLVELVVNLKEAGALGIKVPIDLISDATKVIK